MEKLSRTLPTAWNFVDLTGRKVGRLTVVSYAGKKNGRSFWNCSCECGGTAQVSACSVNSGHAKSCGCLVSEVTTKRNRTDMVIHGHCPRGAPSREYSSWNAMLMRCTNPKNNKYYLYGARGVKVCARWTASFKDFLADMGPRPLGTSLDRYPNSYGNYEPGNCRWATIIQQRRNRRDNTERPNHV